MFTSLRSRAVSHVNSDSDNDDKHLPMHIRVAILPHSLRPVPLTSTDGPMNTDQLKIVLQHMFMGPQHSSTGVVPYSGKPATSKPEKVLPQDVIAGQGPSPAYLKAAAIPSREIALKDRTKPPMVFISLDDVIDAPLPEHLVGGYTDVIARGYLDTLMVRRRSTLAPLAAEASSSSCASADGGQFTGFPSSPEGWLGHCLLHQASTQSSLAKAQRIEVANGWSREGC